MLGSALLSEVSDYPRAADSLGRIGRISGFGEANPLRMTPTQAESQWAAAKAVGLAGALPCQRGSLTAALQVSGSAVSVRVSGFIGGRLGGLVVLDD